MAKPGLFDDLEEEPTAKGGLFDDLEQKVTKRPRDTAKTKTTPKDNGGYIMLGGQRVKVTGPRNTGAEDVSSLRDPAKQVYSADPARTRNEAQAAAMGRPGGTKAKDKEAEMTKRLNRSIKANPRTSREFREEVNTATGAMTQGIRRFTDPLVALTPADAIAQQVGGDYRDVIRNIVGGILPGLITNPINQAAEVATIADPRESPEVRRGAALNIGRDVLLANTGPIIKGVGGAIARRGTGAAEQAIAGAGRAVDEVQAPRTPVEPPIAQQAPEPVTPQAPTVSATPEPTLPPIPKGAKRVRIGDADYDITGEALAEYKKAVVAYRKKVESIKANASTDAKGKEYTNSQLKAAGAQHSANLRRIVGGQTEKEAAQALKQANKVVAGTKVTLADGRKGTAKSNPTYGKVTVVLEDGTTGRFDRADVSPTTPGRTGATKGATKVEPVTVTQPQTVTPPVAHPAPVGAVLTPDPAVAPQPAPQPVQTPQSPPVVPPVAPPVVDDIVDGMRMQDLQAIADANDYALPDKATLSRTRAEVQADAMRNQKAVEESFKGATLEPNPSLTQEEHFIGNLKLRETNAKINELAKAFNASKNPAEREALQGQLDALFGEAEAQAQTLWKSNSNKGRELAFLRSQVPDSFDSAALTVKAERLSGGNLTNKTRQNIIALADKGQKAKATVEGKIRKDANDALERIRKMGSMEEVNLKDLEACR